ncbi:MAG: Uncharacterised protein [Synechococcus sp. MIT S9220]|nr:MAG: Uncharacterised protein [Synechococcus sp. MIT S9220]
MQLGTANSTWIDELPGPLPRYHFDGSDLTSDIQSGNGFGCLIDGNVIFLFWTKSGQCFVDVN